MKQKSAKLPKSLPKEAVRTAGDITYTLKRKNVKNINLRINNNGDVTVSAPPNVPEKYIDEFIISRRGFIKKALEEFESRRSANNIPNEYQNGQNLMLLGRKITLSIEQGEDKAWLENDILHISLCEPSNFISRRKAVQDFMIAEGKKIIDIYLDKYYEIFRGYGVILKKVTVKNMKSRWGSCSHTRGNISLNLQLIFVPPECIEYVVLHEFCHFLEPNHGKNFYVFVEKYMPDWKTRREKLKECVIDTSWL